MLKNTGVLHITVLHSLAQLNELIRLQYLRFLLIDLFAALAIFLFSFYFTKHLLKPIEENQKRQVQFIASASHELRTPLAVMLSSLSAMEKADASHRQIFLQSIKSEGIHLSKLVNEMLTLANADNHSWSIQPENAELDTLLLDCFESFEYMANEKGLSINITLPDQSLPPCFCDPDRIKQVLAILLSNAISNTPTGGYIHLSLIKHGKEFHIQVADNGIGIKDEEKKYVFDRFYRIDNSYREKEHFGLGLCIAKEIIDAHKGTITIKDTSGGGCTFIISLPIKN